MLDPAEPPLDLPALPRRASTAQTVASVLRSQIAAGRILPGVQLREERIATSLEVSRNTVREAFRLLSQERLVEHAMHRGVFVRVIGPGEIRDIYRTRQLVEPLGLRAAAEDPATLANVGSLLAQARASAAQGDWDAVGTADIGFHRQLVAACDSVHLSTMFEGLLAELRLAFLRLADPQGLHEPFLARNQAILELLERSDVDGATTQMHDYLAAAEDRLLRALLPTGAISG